MSNLTSVLYHNIAEHETAFEKGLGVTTRPDRFEEHLDFYQKNYDIVDLDAVISNKLPRKALLITFDDCYRSVLTAAQTLMAPRGIPALFFVNPSLVGGGISLDNIIAWAFNQHGASAVCAALGVSAEAYPDAAALIAKMLSGCTAAQRCEVRERIEDRFPISAEELATRSPMLEAGDFAELKALGVEIGNHTHSHVHCGALAPDEYEQEIVGAQRELCALSGGPVRSFSVAYGHERDLSPPVLKTLRDSGHQAIFLVHARSNRFRKASDIWYRVSFRNEEVRRLPMRLSMLPLIRSARDLVLA